MARTENTRVTICKRYDHYGCLSPFFTAHALDRVGGSAPVMFDYRFRCSTTVSPVRFNSDGRFNLNLNFC